MNLLDKQSETLRLQQEQMSQSQSHLQSQMQQMSQLGFYN